MEVMVRRFFFESHQSTCHHCVCYPTFFFTRMRQILEFRRWRPLLASGSSEGVDGGQSIEEGY